MAQALNHTNGTQSFARKAHERACKNLPVDPLIMFMVTHKAGKLGKVCEDWQSEMNRLSEQVRKGELNYMPEEIYAKVVDPRCYGDKRARKSKVDPASFSLYERNEAQMTALREQLDSEKKKVAKMELRERNLREYMNEALKKMGIQPMLDYLEDDSLDEHEDEDDNAGDDHDVQVYGRVDDNQENDLYVEDDSD